MTERGPSHLYTKAVTNYSALDQSLVVSQATRNENNGTMRAGHLPRAEATMGWATEQ